MCDASGRLASSPLADLSSEEFAVWAGFLQTHAALARELDADLRAAHGLPLTDFEILLWLANRPCEGMRMAALADTVLLSPSGLSRAVERLETRGLVQRIPCTEDRRGAYAALTESGSRPGADRRRDARGRYPASLPRSTDVGRDAVAEGDLGPPAGGQPAELRPARNAGERNR